MAVWMHTLLVNYGYAAIFTVLFLNNFGLPIPGTTLLLAAGFLVGTGTLTLWGTAGTAAVACFLGSTCSYAIGRRYGAHLLENIHWLKITHKRLRYMEHFFKRYGAKGVFFARFVSVLHPVIGLLSGIGKTPLKPFLFFNFTGSVSYALLYTLVGEYFGHRWGFHRLWQYHMTIFVIILVIVLIVMSVFWSHSICTFFGHPIYKRKVKGFWSK